MNIHFYLNNEEATPLVSFLDVQSNPFKLNDVMHLDVEELVPAEYDGYNEDFKKNIINNNLELAKIFDRKKVKLVTEGKYVKFNVISDSRLDIEYYCEFV